MTKNFRFFAMLLGACAALPAYAGESTAVKCGPNQERVWVYDSLTSFDIAAKLKCGETVEMISRVKGYVKVRTQNGTEGFVTDASFTDLPPFVDDKDKQQATLPQLAARRAVKPVDNPAPAVAVVTPVPSRPSSVASAAVSSPVAVSNVSVVSTVAVAPATAPAPSNPPSAHPSSASTAAVTTLAPASSTIAASPKTPSPTAPASTSVAGSSSTAYAVAVSSSSRTSPAKNGSTSASSAKASTNKSSNSSSSSATPGARPAAPAPTPAPSSPKAAPATTVSTSSAETTAVLAPARETPALHPVKASTAPESEDYPDFEPVSESADPACQVFFSAYGLSPAQFKWFSQSRKKKYPAICPAPDVSRVDFVLIFTHDVDIYSTTMPSPVHTDHNGFSDFSPMTMVDTAVISGSTADKARHEYVWVFTMKRGAFDPSRFSPRRRPQFTKSESNSLAGHSGSLKTVDDAFHFMEGQGESR